MKGAKDKTPFAAENAEDTYAYDDMGNLQIAAFNFTTNTYTANSLNQYTSILCDSASLREISHDLDGNMTSDGVFAYSYDAANRLASVSSASLTNGAVRVVNAYDCRNRRICKTVQRYADSNWQTIELHSFVYDSWNLIHETVATISGVTTNTAEIQYFWGADLSNTLQGAGGVGGLLALSVNGDFYFPTYDNNGNVTKYIDENGNVVAAYEYNPFGKTISQSGPLADFFRHRFSTKYYDSETCLYYFGYRFYSPTLMRWLNRDPIEESGGQNLYGFCGNNALSFYDPLGDEVVVIRHLKGVAPPGGWGDAGRNRAQTHYLEPDVACKKVKKGNCKIGFSVTIAPPITIVHVYFRADADLIIANQHENEHLHWIRIYDNAIETFKKEAEQIVDYPDAAYFQLSLANKKMNRVKSRAATESHNLDKKGGPHGH